MIKKILKSFFVLLAMLMSQVAWAAFQYETTTYDFLTAANTEGNSITMSETQYSDITDAFYGATMTYGNNTVDISKFAFKEGYSRKGWWLRGNDSGGEGLKPQNEDGLEFAICDLHAGDIVTITYSNTLSYARGAHIYNANSPGGVTSITSGTPYTVAQDGDLVLTCNNMYIYIQTITIQELTSVATYSITSNVNSNGIKENKFEFTGEGRLMDTHIVIPFLDVEFGSDLNATFVRSIGDGKYGSYIPDENGYWHTWFGEKAPYQGTFYKFKPTADGKFQAKGNLENGEVYLFEVIDETQGSYTPIGASSGTGYVTVVNGQWVDLKKGKTYYICEHPNDGSRDNNNFQLHWFQFNNYFDVPELGKVLENGATGGELVTVKTNGQPGGTLTGWSVKRTSPNIKNEEESSNLQVTCTNGVVSISGIEYKDENKDKAGVMILDLNFSGGDATFVVTIPYSAEKGHIWNFYDTSKSTNPGSGILDIGQYKTSGSKLRQDTDNGEWEFTYRVINQQGQGTHDPMYKNVHDMEGNNADMIWDTEGLWFETATKQSILYNENDVNNAIYTDRYVGILPGGSFTIPGLKKDDRVLIFMGSGDGSGTDVCFFNITNALDAIGSPISPSDTYKAGGTLWNGDHGDNNLRGAYHFIAAADGPMTFYMNGGSMTKIYSIEIYQGKHKWTDDATRLDNRRYNGEEYKSYAYQLLNTYKTTTDVAKAAYTLHYRGKGEALRTPTVVYTSGNITVNTTGDSPNLVYQHQGNEHNIFYKSVKGEAGLFRMRIDCMEMGGNYVTDYGLQNITVGYLDKMPYPYTWDFTDLMKYAYTDNANRIKADMSSSAAYNNANYIDEFMNKNGYNSVEVWKKYDADGIGGSGYGLCVRNNDNEGSGELSFVGGGQLYAASKFITETSGLGINPRGFETKRNGRLRITDEGLSLYEQQNDYWRITIPEVPADAAVYVRAKAISGRTPATNTAFTYTTQTGDGDYIYALKGTGTDMTIALSNMIVQKIAVATDAKTVNNFGWNTESRNHAIDPSLMSYMTGKDFRAYVVTKADVEENTVTLVRIDGGSEDASDINADNTGKDWKLIVPGANDGDKYAYIVRYVDADPNKAENQQTVNIFNDNNGFHLFVPDMHDATSTNFSGNLLKAKVSSSETEGGKRVPRNETVGDKNYNNYAFTSRHRNVVMGGQWMDGPQAFYRIVSDGARTNGNQAYLSIEGPASSRSAEPSSSSEDDHYDIIFKDWKDLEAERGDVNGDGVVTQPDVELLTDYVTTRYSNGLFKRMGDMNDDGRVDIVDMTLLIKKIMSE